MKSHQRVADLRVRSSHMIVAIWTRVSLLRCVGLLVTIHPSVRSPRASFLDILWTRTPWSHSSCSIDFPLILTLQEQHNQDLNTNLERVQREMCHFDVSWWPLPHLHDGASNQVQSCLLTPLRDSTLILWTIRVNFCPEGRQHQPQGELVPLTPLLTSGFQF